MEMPKPGPDQKQIAQFAGDWVGDEKVHPSPWDPKGGSASATITNRTICDGFYVAGDYEQKRDGKVTYRGHSVIGFDQEEQEVVMHWFDSMGIGADEFRGKFHGSALALVCKNSMGTHRLTYDFGEQGTLRARMEMSNDGTTWAPMFDGTYHRQ